MKLLAIETATEACSVALSSDGAIVERHEIAPRRHAQLLLPMIDEVLAEAGVSKRQLDAIAVGRGPGAFTGVRLAISVAQGLALGLDRPAVAVSTLAALAMGAVAVPPLRQHARIAAAIDARMGEVYFGWFAPDDDGLVTPISDERVGLADDVPVGDPGAFTAMGTGWATYRDALTARLGTPSSIDADALPHASDVARLALREIAHGRTVDASHLQPVYLRDKVAQTLIEQGKPVPQRVEFD